MTAPLDLDGIESSAKKAEDGCDCYGLHAVNCPVTDFYYSANPATVLALIARVREAENECADLTTVRNNYRYEHVALKDELTEARARIEALKLADKVVEAARSVCEHSDFDDATDEFGARLDRMAQSLSALDAGEK